MKYILSLFHHFYRVVSSVCFRKQTKLFGKRPMVSYRAKGRNHVNRVGFENKYGHWLNKTLRLEAHQLTQI